MEAIAWVGMTCLLVMWIDGTVCGIKLLFHGFRKIIVQEVASVNVPLLEATPRSDGHGLKVYCVYCQKWHFHGHGDGHRTAHCDNEHSPYLKTGYELVTHHNQQI